jgi:methionine sulfoxide reductase heme-binding subunit
MKHWPIWLGLAVGFVAIAIGLLTGGAGQEGWQLAARYTARASFPLFIATFSASAVVRLYPADWAKALLRNRRDWGLGFAAAFALHLVALSVNNALQDNFPPAGPTDPGFIAYTLLLAMALTSTDAARRHLGRWWKVLHTAGMWLFWMIFAVQPYFEAILRLEWPDRNPLGDPYTMTCLAAAGMRLLAWYKGWRKRRAA